ncbi:MAG TPA: SpoIIE family protein phosphatase [Candidatus Saccharimonadales bacterium]|nr:SpoIIE family protein phosphatase [Candidatus Saccharimonadales bacterium]
MPKRRELTSPAVPAASRPLPLGPVLLLSAATVVLALLIRHLPWLHWLRLVLAAAAVWQLIRARKRPAGRFRGGYRAFWIGLTALAGAVGPTMALWVGVLFGLTARKGLTPWLRDQRSVLLALLLLTTLAALVLPSLAYRATESGAETRTVSLAELRTGVSGQTAGEPPAPRPAGPAGYVDRALYGLLQAWLLLAALRAVAELVRRWIRGVSIRSKLVVAYGIFALVPAVLAVCFVAVAAWMRAGEFRVTSLAQELSGHSRGRPWVAGLERGPGPASAADLADRLRGHGAFLQEMGLAAAVLGREPGGWRVVATVGGPERLFLPAAAPVTDSGTVVRGLALRAGSFYWVESALWPRRGDTLAVMTFEPVDSARIAAFGRQMRCDVLLYGAPEMTASRTEISISQRGTRLGVGQLSEQREADSLEAAALQKAFSGRPAVPESVTRAREDSLVRRLGIVSVGSGVYAAARSSNRVPNMPSTGSSYDCANWAGTRWKAGAALLLARVNLWETLGLRSAASRGMSTWMVILLAVIGGLFLVVALVSVLYGSRVASFITRGVANLRAATARVRDGDFSARVAVPSEDELGELAESFNLMAAGLEVGQRAVLEREHLRHELELARRIQVRLLPSAPPVVPRLDVAATNAMSLQVGGDYYDFVPVVGGRIGFCVADVSGKGVGAALLMSNVKAALQAGAAANPAPAEIVAGVNRLLERSIESGKFVTLFLGVLDPATLRLEYVNAGHPAPMLLRRSGVMERLEMGGFVLGVDARASYEVGTTVLASGDLLALYTDGVNEAQGEGEELFGDERVEALLRRAQGLAAADLLSQLVAEVRAFEGERGPSDDLTAMVLAVS